LEKENVFEGICKSKLFWGNIGLTLVLQVVMVESLKKFADTKRIQFGLIWRQWIVFVCIGLITIGSY